MSASDVVATLTASPAEPAQVLVSGGVGTGKTELCARIVEALRANGITVLTRPPRPGDPPAAAVVIDDVQLCDDDDLGALTEEIAAGARTVVVAAPPLTSRAALAELTAAAGRRRPVVSLGPLGPAEIASVATESMTTPPPPELVRAVATATAGLPFLVRPAVAAAVAPDGETPGAAISAATRAALVERLRRLPAPLVDALLVSSLSPELGPDDVAGALTVDTAAAQALVDEARGTGLIAPSHGVTFLRTLHRCAAQVAGVAHHHDVELRLLHSQLEKATLTADLAIRLAEHGMRHPLLATALTDLADGAGAYPERAARLYRAAAEADAGSRDARLADALAGSGDCTAARRLADELLASDDAAERAAAVRIAASVAAHDGAIGQAAELFAWLGSPQDVLLGAAATVVSLGVGDVAAARAYAAVPDAGPPTSQARGARALAAGLLATLDAPYPAAVGTLSQALDAPPPVTVVTPDTASALVALVALHGGDPARARRAVARHGTESPFTAPRHRLLQAWLHVLDGQLAAAATAPTATDLHRRDALWATAVQTAAARRGGDVGALQKHWNAGAEVLAEYALDLYALLPVGELWVAAVRLGVAGRMAHVVDAAFGLLERLGNPPLWAVPLHWAGVHAGILANDPAAVAPHGQALAAAAGDSPFARALANAGRAWLRVLAGQVDVPEVGAAARGLAAHGLGWDATRLASQAALHTPDGRVSAAMLQLARDLRATAPVPEPVPEPSRPARPSASSQTSASATTARPAPAAGALSAREREVAELVLQGMPYRDIGSRLLISAKTVEHHVARIRRRLGAESRSELISMLRALLEG